MVATNFVTTVCMDLEPEKLDFECIRKNIPCRDVENDKLDFTKSKASSSDGLAPSRSQFCGVGPSGTYLPTREGFSRNHGKWALDPIKRANSVDLGRFDSALWELGNSLSKGGAKFVDCNPTEGGPTIPQ